MNAGRASCGILCRMLFIEFHRRRGLSEFSEITSAKYFDLASVIILLHVFVLPGKINVFQHGGDSERSRPQCPKNAHNLTLRQMS